MKLQYSYATIITMLNVKLIRMVFFMWCNFKLKCLFLSFLCVYPAFVGTDITNDIEMLTNNKGSTVLFYNGFKYLKSGESKTSYQYRCVHYMKKCRSRIIFNRENETAMKNKIEHTHREDRHAYDNFRSGSVIFRRFGKHKVYQRRKSEKQQLDDEDETEK